MYVLGLILVVLGFILVGYSVVKERNAEAIPMQKISTRTFKEDVERVTNIAFNGTITALRKYSGSVTSPNS